MRTRYRLPREPRAGEFRQVEELVAHSRGQEIDHCAIALIFRRRVLSRNEGTGQRGDISLPGVERRNQVGRLIEPLSIAKGPS